MGSDTLWLARVPRRDLDVSLCLDAGLQLTAALEFGVELRSEPRDVDSLKPTGTAVTTSGDA